DVRRGDGAHRARGLCATRAGDHEGAQGPGRLRAPDERNSETAYDRLKFRWEESMQRCLHSLRAVHVTIVVLALGALALPASAQTYPTRNVHLVVPYAAGGTGDIVARVISDRLAAALGQTVVGENRPGASGSIGTKGVIAAPADGHTLLVGQTGEISINPHWNKSLGYDPEQDLAPIALATIVPLALVVPGKASYSTVA